MNIEEIHEYCISRPGLTEGFPFNDTALVFKVIKIFALLYLSEVARGISLKCDSERAIELREPPIPFMKNYPDTVYIRG